MNATTTLTDPQLAGDEIATLRGFLDYQRDVMRRKTEGLTETQLNHALPPSTMTLGGMLKHLALVEIDWLTGVFHNRPIGEPWQGVDWEADRDWDWHSAVHDSPEQLRRLLDVAIAEADRGIDEALASGGLDAMSAKPDGERFSLRWIVVHLIEEYARHLGHADLLRESIDGSVGD